MKQIKEDLNEILRLKRRRRKQVRGTRKEGSLELEIVRTRRLRQNYTKKKYDKRELELVKRTFIKNCSMIQHKK